MNKSTVMKGMFIGATIGGFVPVLFGADSISYWSLLGSTAGGVLGIWITYKLFD